jgi:hypothetical protein
MALNIPPGFAQVAYRWALSGDPDEFISTVGMDISGIPGGPQAAAEDAADQFLAGFGAGEFNVGYTYRGVFLKVGEVGGPPSTYEAARAVAGTFPGNPLPQNCCVLVKKRSGTVGRRGQGRMYLPPFMVQENAVSPAGVIDAANMPGIQLNVDQWLSELRDWVILHDTPPGGVARPPTPITNFIVDGVIATQRRRLRR